MTTWSDMTEEQKDHARAVRRARTSTPEWKAKRAAKRRSDWSAKRNLINEAFGGKCEHCGATSDLEWNHRYPSRKTGEFSDDMENSLETFVARHSDDLQLLCHTCHHTLSKRQQDVAWQLLCDLTEEQYDNLMSR